MLVLLRCFCCWHGRRQKVSVCSMVSSAKYQRRFPDFDAKIMSMYARGMTVREIQGHLEELYGLMCHRT